MDVPISEMIKSAFGKFSRIKIKDKLPRPNELEFYGNHLPRSFISATDNTVLIFNCRLVRYGCRKYPLPPVCEMNLIQNRVKCDHMILFVASFKQCRKCSGLGSRKIIPILYVGVNGKRMQANSICCITPNFYQVPSYSEFAFGNATLAEHVFA